MKIIIPLAGKDKRFEKIGVYKPLINVNDTPLIYHVLEFNKFPFENLHFIILNEHEKKFSVKNKLKNAFGSSSHIYIIDKETEGSPNTILEIEDVISDEEEILIELGDVVRDVFALSKEIKRSKYDGIIPIDPHFTAQMWGYVKLEGDKVTYLYEKSTERMRGGATMGLYYFSQGKKFVKYAKQMIKKQIKIPPYDLYYVGVVYNEYISDHKNIGKSEAQILSVLGSPAQVDDYLKLVRYNK